MKEYDNLCHLENNNIQTIILNNLKKMNAWNLDCGNKEPR